MADLTIAEIPYREMDDPPNGTGSESEGESLLGIIEELSRPEHNEINRD
jgi:hypothetical protein